MGLLAARGLGPLFRQPCLFCDFPIDDLDATVGARRQPGIMGYDEITAEYLEGRAQRPYEPVASDPDAGYEKAKEVARTRGVRMPMLDT